MKPVIIFCKMCDKETKHGDVGILPVVKCVNCGEYATLMTEEKKTVVDEIMEPAEKVWKAMVELANNAHGHGGGKRIKKDLYSLAQELDASLSFIHRNIESLIAEPEFVDDVIDTTIFQDAQDMLLDLEDNDGRGTQ